jgi:hypothetical protein
LIAFCAFIDQTPFPRKNSPPISTRLTAASASNTTRLIWPSGARAPGLTALLSAPTEVNQRDTFHNRHRRREGPVKMNLRAPTLFWKRRSPNG